MSRIFSFVATVSVALFAGQAAQADGHPMNSGGNWQGAYVGAHVGTGEASYDGRFDSNEPVAEQGFASDLDLSGGVGGVQAGYNRQTGNFVYGVEADITFTDFEDSALERDNNNSDGMDGSVDWLATLRARAGVARGNVLVFATAGIAFADASYTANNGPVGAPTSSGSVDFDDMGYVVGGGVELMGSGRMSFRLEGLYYGFDDREDASTLNTDSDPDDFAKFEDAWVVRAGVNFKLGGRRSMAPPLK